jgi:predicted GH43/DUF377 family glycosyl hydrolase
MKWRKRGRIYCPSGELWWARSYATLPTVEARGEELRIYFAALDDDRRGRVGWIDVRASDPSKVLAESREPVLDVGQAGLFDDSGVNPTSLLRVADRTLLYYIGWQRCEAVPYLLFAGAAEAAHDGSFSRVSPVPILERSEKEPFLRSAMAVIEDSGGYRAWYVSATGWTTLAGRLYPQYAIHHARSADGLRWTADSQPCVGLAGDEFGLGRPWVVKDAECYRMWYSIRSRSRPYTIGYAESPDGRQWTRRDEQSGISASNSGWDSEMICYACVVDAGGERLMFYNGNRHGQSGFGWAVLES